MINQCVVGCLKQYGKDLSWKSIAIVVSSVTIAVALGDFTGVFILKILTAAGISDSMMAISACIAKCIRDARSDS